MTASSRVCLLCVSRFPILPVSDRLDGETANIVNSLNPFRGKKFRACFHPSFLNRRALSHFGCRHRPASHSFLISLFVVKNKQKPAGYFWNTHRHGNLAYSTLACFSTGMSGSAVFQRLRKTW